MLAFVRFRNVAFISPRNSFFIFPFFSNLLRQWTNVKREYVEISVTVQH